MNKQNSSIGIIGGAGHVGLPLSLLLVDKGYSIKVIDNDQKELLIQELLDRHQW